ncbi:MAG: DNA polymerase III subunit delta, partial [Pseudomonadota bacterium]|nr:DNA polymerase III subunit delta [Pseudomonadota bacterium]
NHKPDANTLLQLERFIASPNDNQLLIVMPKQDSQAQKTKFYKTIEANGWVVTLNIRSESERRQLLQQMATSQGLQLTPEAWTLLLSHTENNLLAAHQALLRLSALHDISRPADLADLKPALVEQSRFSTFDLADAALQGQAEKALQILQFLQESGEPESLVLWTLAKEMRLVMQLLSRPNSEQQLGIWQNRVSLYRLATRRLSLAETQDWSDLLRQADECIKGIRDEPTWDLLLRCTLALAGIRLFGCA